MNRALFTGVALLCIAGSGCSCRESRRRVPSTPFARPLEAAFSEASQEPVVSGREFPVTGSVRMDDAAARIGGLTVHLIKTNPDGGEIIYWAAQAPLERREGDEFRFECQMKAPKDSGEYLLHAIYKRDKIAESKISVMPDPASDAR